MVAVYRASPDAGHETCHVVEGAFALLIQALLGLTVVVVLFYKRWQEHPRRTCVIWFMDCSKQCWAMGLQHLVNLLLALFFAKHSGAKAGECIWYITNFAINVVCGLFLLTAYMRLHRCAVEKWELTWLRSGEYGDPEAPRWDVWLVQLLLWGFVCCVEKFITATVVILPLHHHIDTVIAFIEKPIKDFPRTELVFVMVVFPMILNAVFAWVVDNLIKDPDAAHKHF
mmetsp:Transcript_15647/g.36559  ORF Transcript_15647/g.36559 Transcript_15647/m.36559 type:complete len:227 (-) Transcript_15647:88-768(-)